MEQVRVANWRACTQVRFSNVGNADFVEHETYDCVVGEVPPTPVGSSLAGVVEDDYD